MVEDDIFKYAQVDFEKLITYGFYKQDSSFVFEKKFMNEQFRAIINVLENGKVSGKVIDNVTDEEYFNIRIRDNVGKFSGEVLKEYRDILNDIKNKCFNQEYFMFSQTNRINKYILDKYNNKPEFLWERNFHDGIFRNISSNKWYGIIMLVDKGKITNGFGMVEVMNLKIKQDKIKNLLLKNGYYPAYHMNKKYWISIILDDTLDDKTIQKLIDESYKLVSK